MEGHCSTGQSPQWAVVPMEEGEEEEEEEEAEQQQHSKFLLHILQVLFKNFYIYRCNCILLSQVHCV